VTLRNCSLTGVKTVKVVAGYYRRHCDQQAHPAQHLKMPHPYLAELAYKTAMLTVFGLSFLLF